MDLKVNYVSMVADIGNFDGSIFDLVLHLRERSISELIRMCQEQLNFKQEDFTDSGKAYGNVAVEAREGNPTDEDERFYQDTPASSVPQLASSLLDTDISVKIGKYQAVIAYFDNIIKLNGVTSSSNPAQEAVNKYGSLDGVYMTYGKFAVSSSYSVLLGG